MSGGLYSPWGEVEIAHGRTGAARLASVGARHEARPPVGGSWPEEDPAPGAGAAAGQGRPDVAPSAGQAPAGENGGSDNPAGVGFVEVSGHALMMLQLVAAHHGCTLGRAIEFAAFAHCEQIGLPSLLDAKMLQGRAAAPATSHTCGAEEGRTDAAFGGVRPEPQPP